MAQNLDKSLEAISRRMGLPLHEQVRRHLRQLVETQFKDGERFFPERELIERLGVSQPTVRRALNDLAGEGLLDRGVGKGTFVRKSVRNRSVGIFLPMMDSTLQLSLIRNLAGLCAERDYGFHIYNLRPNRSIKEICEGLRRSPQEERLLFFSTSENSTWELYHELDKRGYRSVYLSGDIAGYPGNAVKQDKDSATHLMMEHLMSLGHKRIAFIVNEPVALSSIRQRLESIKAFLQSHHMDEAMIFDCQLQTWDNSFAEAYSKMEEIMAISPRPTAICPLSAAGTWAALRYLTQHQIRVPEQMSLFSFDDLPGSDQIYPALTALTYSPKLEQFALDMLWDDAPGRQSTVIVPPELIVRESTGPASL